MEKLVLLSAAYGWFAGLLVVMIIVTALFGLILYIAIKPIKKDGLAETSASSKLKRREAELTVELLKNKGDSKKTDELLKDLREVKSAEKLVNELMDEPEAEQAAPAKPVQPKPAEKPAEKKAEAPAAEKPAEEKKGE